MIFFGGGQMNWSAEAAALYQLLANPEKQRLLLLWLFTFSCALQDFLKRKIYLFTYLIFVVPGIIDWARHPAQALSCLWGLIPGILLLLLVWLLPGSVGGGDALYFLVAAFYETLPFLTALLFLSLLLCGVAALCLFVRKRGQGGRQTLPYLCFVLPALWLLSG